LSRCFGLGSQHHDVGARALDGGGERLADAHEHADLRQHQQPEKARAITAAM
jgi:hypothetical protein